MTKQYFNLVRRLLRRVMSKRSSRMQSPGRVLPPVVVHDSFVLPQGKVEAFRPVWVVDRDGVVEVSYVPLCPHDGSNQGGMR